MSHAHARPGPGESAPFHFETTWRVADSVDSVWSVLTAVDEWPQWWPGIAAAVSDGSGVRTGSRAKITVRSPLGIDFAVAVSIDHLVAPQQVRLVADGDLRGGGVWSLTQSGPVTAISSVWCVTTRHPIVRAVRPVSALMHGIVMAAGETGLRRRLSARA